MPITGQLTAVGGLRYTSSDNEGYWRDLGSVSCGSVQHAPAMHSGIFTPPLLLSSSEEKDHLAGGPELQA